MRSPVQAIVDSVAATIDRQRLVLLCVWFGFITTLALTPLSVKERLHTTGRWHPQLHVAAFLVAGLLLFIEGRGNLFRAFALVLFGGTLEWLQVFFYGNGFEWKDLFNNCVGIVFALFLKIPPW